MCADAWHRLSSDAEDTKRRVRVEFNICLDTFADTKLISFFIITFIFCDRQSNGDLKLCMCK